MIHVTNQPNPTNTAAALSVLEATIADWAIEAGLDPKDALRMPFTDLHEWCDPNVAVDNAAMAVDPTVADLTGEPWFAVLNAITEAWNRIRGFESGACPCQLS